MGQFGNFDIPRGSFEVHSYPPPPPRPEPSPEEVVARAREYRARLHRNATHPVRALLHPGDCRRYDQILRLCRRDGVTVEEWLRGEVTFR
jgi:hypothetical protein